MKIKKEILEDAGDPRNGLIEYANLEVMIDIRDTLVELTTQIRELKNLYNSELIHK